MPMMGPGPLLPITLSPEEYQAFLNDLASRDPLMRFLMQKQDQAQAQANANGAADDDKPMRVVRGAAVRDGA